MPTRKEPAPPEEYYHPVLKDTRYNNAAFRAIYFEQTEPKDGRPKHTRVMHTTRAKAIAQKMVIQIMLDVMRNSKIAWARGTALPGQMDYDQPLGEAGGDFD